MPNSSDDPLFDAIPSIVIGCWASILVFVLVLLVNPLLSASPDTSGRSRRAMHRTQPVVTQTHAAAPCQKQQ